MAIENSITPTLEPHKNDPKKTPALHYFPSTDIKSLNNITNNFVFYIAHYKSSQNALIALDRNGENSDLLKEIYDVKTAKEYIKKLGSVDDYLKRSKAIHMSNTEGIGVHLETHPELDILWGRDGTNAGLAEKEELKKILNYALNKNISISIETAYDLKNIPKNKFSEADSFIEYVLK